MALMTEERRKEMEEEMNRFEQEIALPGDEDSPELLPEAHPPREHEAPPNVQRRKPQVTLEPSVLAVLPEVLRKGPPPPPPLSPPITRLLTPPPPPPVLDAPRHSEPRFIPHQVNRHQQRPPMRPNFMGMRGPMPPPPGHFPHPGSMNPFDRPFGHQGNQGPMMGGPHMMPGPMQQMQHGPPMHPPPHNQMGNIGPNMPMPPGFHHHPPSGHIPNVSREPHFMPRMQNQFNSSAPPQSTSENSTSSTVTASAPAVYAAPFMKSHGDNVSEVSSAPNGQMQNLPIVMTPVIQKVEKPPVSRVEETATVTVFTASVPEEVVVSKKKEKKKKVVRMAGGQAWEDNSLQEWESDDFRIFCGDLGNDVTDEVLIRAFSKYTSFVKAKVIRDKRTNKTKGYGFVSFKDPQDFIKAMREMNGRYVGSRPIKLRKSTWRDRNIDIVKKKQKEKEKLGLL